MQVDRRQQDDERCRTRRNVAARRRHDRAAERQRRSAGRRMAVIVRLVRTMMMPSRRVDVVVRVRMGVRVRVVVRVRERQPPPHLARESARADHRDHEAGPQRDPRIDLLGDDPLRRRQNDEAQHQDARRVRDGERRGENDRVARRRPCTDEGNGEQRLPMTGFERVQRAERDREKQCTEHDERIRRPAPQDVGKRVRTAERHLGRCVRLDGRRGPAEHGAVRVDDGREGRGRTRRREQRARIRAELIGRLALRARNDVSPAEAPGFGPKSRTSARGLSTSGRRRPSSARPLTRSSFGRRLRKSTLLASDTGNSFTRDS